MHELLKEPSIAALRAQAHATDDETLRDQLLLVQIPAPSFGESARAEYLRGRFEELGLEGVEIDGVGNLLARLPGPGDPSAAPVVLCAHLDTVFPAGTPLAPRHEAGRIHAPGIADNCRGLAALLAIARLLVGSGTRTRAPLHLVASVGEEGIGDLRGVKHLFRDGSEHRRAAAFVSLDGSGIERVVCRSIGSRRIRATVSGPGGHSWADRGTANPLHALGDGITRLGRLRPEPGAAASLTVARCGGGTSINSIPDSAALELDIRAEAPSLLLRLEELVRGALERAVERENACRLRGTDPLGLQLEVIGDRPSGATDADARLVRAAVDATRAVGERAVLAASSTDANVPMALGIPAITVGAGGQAGGVHTLGEWYSNEGGPLGIERALLLALASAGLERPGIRSEAAD